MNKKRLSLIFFMISGISFLILLIAPSRLGYIGFSIFLSSLICCFIFGIIYFIKEKKETTKIEIKNNTSFESIIGGFIKISLYAILAIIAYWIIMNYQL